MPTGALVVIEAIVTSGRLSWRRRLGIAARVAAVASPISDATATGLSSAD